MDDGDNLAGLSKPSRPIDICAECGQEQEIAAHGLCFGCYRRLERKRKRQIAGVDRHNPALRPEHKRLFRGFNAIMAGIADLRISQADAMAMRELIGPYVTPVEKYLKGSEVNSELENDVHSSRE